MPGKISALVSGDMQVSLCTFDGKNFFVINFNKLNRCSKASHTRSQDLFYRICKFPYKELKNASLAEIRQCLHDQSHFEICCENVLFVFDYELNVEIRNRSAQVIQEILSDYDEFNDLVFNRFDFKEFLQVIDFDQIPESVYHYPEVAQLINRLKQKKKNL